MKCGRNPPLGLPRRLTRTSLLCTNPLDFSGGVRRRLFAYRRSPDVLNPLSPRTSANPQGKRHVAFTGGPLVGG